MGNRDRCSYESFRFFSIHRFVTDELNPNDSKNVIIGKMTLYPPESSEPAESVTWTAYDIMYILIAPDQALNGKSYAMLFEPNADNASLVVEYLKRNEAITMSCPDYDKLQGKGIFVWLYCLKGPDFVRFSRVHNPHVEFPNFELPTSEEK